MKKKKRHSVDDFILIQLFANVHRTASIYQTITLAMLVFDDASAELYSILKMKKKMIKF